MLLYGELPSKAELADYKHRLKALRDLPQALKEVLERIPRDAHPMDVMRTGCSLLGTLEPELTFGAGADLRCSARQDRPSAGAVPGSHVLLVSLQSPRRAHRLQQRRGQPGWSFPLSVARQEAQRSAREGDAICT